MMKRVTRLFVGMVIGIAALVGGIWILSAMLSEREMLYQGKSLNYWLEQSQSSNSIASNEAIGVLNSQIIPQLTDVMFHDTNDSKLRLILIDHLNVCPGVFIRFTPAGGRRLSAGFFIGEFGPSAKAAIPALIQAVKGPDKAVRGAAISSLGKIHGEPDVVIPLLIPYLDDADLNGDAAEALGNFGPLASNAVPKLIPVLQSPDKDARRESREALKKIDPEAFAQALQDLREKAAARGQPTAK